MYYLCKEFRRERVQRYEKIRWERIIQSEKDMRRYWFELEVGNGTGLGAALPDGSNRQAAINRARQWMRDNGVRKAVLTVNSMRTDNLPDVIDIEID